MSQLAHDEAVERMGGSNLVESDRHHLLSAKRRRTVLEVLADYSGPVMLESLVEGVLERDDACNATDEQCRADVKLSLHHVHLPAMDSLDFIEYDHVENRIR